jgi:hypothetical protein
VDLVHVFRPKNGRRPAPAKKKEGGEMSENKLGESTRFAAVRIWVHRPRVGYADVLIPTSMITSKMRIRVADDLAVRLALFADANCIQWFNNQKSTSSDIMFNVSFTLDKCEMGASYALFPTKDDELQCIPMSAVPKHGVGSGRVTNDTN